MQLVAILFKRSDLILELVLQVTKFIAVLTNLLQHGELKRLVARDFIPLILG